MNRKVLSVVIVIGLGVLLSTACWFYEQRWGELRLVQQHRDLILYPEQVEVVSFMVKNDTPVPRLLTLSVRNLRGQGEEVRVNVEFDRNNNGVIEEAHFERILEDYDQATLRGLEESRLVLGRLPPGGEAKLQLSFFPLGDKLVSSSFQLLVTSEIP